jgi:hypothetical protein
MTHEPQTCMLICAKQNHQHSPRFCTAGTVACITQPPGLLGTTHIMCEDERLTTVVIAHRSGRQPIGRLIQGDRGHCARCHGDGVGGKANTLRTGRHWEDARTPVEHTKARLHHHVSLPGSSLVETVSVRHNVYTAHRRPCPPGVAWCWEPAVPISHSASRWSLVVLQCKQVQFGSHVIVLPYVECIPGGAHWVFDVVLAEVHMAPLPVQEVCLQPGSALDAADSKGSRSCKHHGSGAATTGALWHTYIPAAPHAVSVTPRHVDGVWA